MTSMMRFAALLAVLGVAALAVPTPAADTADEKDAKAVVDKAYGFLKSRQTKDGGFAKGFGPGVPAIIAAALIRNGYSTDDPVVKGALGYLTKRVQKNGGIYEK